MRDEVEVGTNPCFFLRTNHTFLDFHPKAVKQAPRSSYRRTAVSDRKTEADFIQENNDTVMPSVNSPNKSRDSCRSDLPEGEKHFLIISGRHHTATLFIRHYYDQVQHQGRHFPEGAVRSAELGIIANKGNIFPS